MCFTVQLSRLSVFATALLFYHVVFNLSRTFLKFFQVLSTFLLNSFSSLSQLFHPVKNFFLFFKRKRRRRDLNPRAAINDLLPFQGSPFGQLGYFSKLSQIRHSIGITFFTLSCSLFSSLRFYRRTLCIISHFLFICQVLFSKTFQATWQAERVGFEPTRPCGQTVFKTASL